MAGIYFHIPFCKKACHYCDFHFSTSIANRSGMLQAMHTELKLQKPYLAGLSVETIYFGGGTPSLISAEEIARLIDSVSEIYGISGNAEITLEANPDDLTAAKISELRSTPVNRFSIGIQSFFDEDLAWMNRAHSASEADGSVKRVQDAGFENITADLIYGYPLLSDEKWRSNLQRVTDLQIPHVSAYGITVEPDTALAHFIRKKQQPAVSDEQSSAQFMILMEALQAAGFEHYEISNFAMPGYYSRHNTAYWKNEKYLGIGPSAHSYNGETRQWNVSNNAKYIESLQRNVIPAETEVLTLRDRANEYIMTSLRTMWGMDLNRIERDYGEEVRSVISRGLSEFTETGKINLENDIAILTNAGKQFADRIASDLFIEESVYER